MQLILFDEPLSDFFNNLINYF